MKVTGNVNNNLNSVDSAKANKTQDLKNQADVSKNENAVQSAKVNISGDAHLFNKAKAIANQTDTVDEAKVARLQKLIDEGKYNVDASAVADRLVDSHLGFPE